MKLFTPKLSTHKLSPLLLAVLMPLAHGFPLPETMAPGFETTAVVPVKDNPAGKVVEGFKLSSLLGKSRVMIFSYPKNCTYICPTELIALKKNLDKFQDLGFEVLVLSTDEASLEKDKEASHQAWRLKSDKAGAGDKKTPIGIGNADFIMLSDPNKKIITTYGIESQSGHALRATFLIGMDGKVYVADVQSNSIGRDIDELIRKAEAVKYLEENKDRVLPEGWKPGDKGMEPSHEGVRKQMKPK